MKILNRTLLKSTIAFRYFMTKKKDVKVGIRRFVDSFLITLGLENLLNFYFCMLI